MGGGGQAKPLRSWTRLTVVASVRMPLISERQKQAVEAD